MAALQIRDVPDEVHAVLRDRAAAAGQSLTEYVLALLAEHTEKPTLEEWFAELDQDEPVELPRPAAEYIREAREDRERDMDQWHSS